MIYLEYTSNWQVFIKIILPVMLQLSDIGHHNKLPQASWIKVAKMQQQKFSQHSASQNPEIEALAGICCLRSHGEKSVLASSSLWGRWRPVACPSVTPGSASTFTWSPCHIFTVYPLQRQRSLGPVRVIWDDLISISLVTYAKALFPNQLTLPASNPCSRVLVCV